LESKQREKASHGEEGETKHSPRIRRNGGTPLGHSGRIALKREQGNDREKEHALLGNGSVGAFLRKRDAGNNTVTMETGVFSVGSTPRLYSKDPRLAECISVKWSEVVGW
jgi:hypothetical protein